MKVTVSAKKNLHLFAGKIGIKSYRFVFIQLPLAKVLGDPFIVSAVRIVI